MKKIIKGLAVVAVLSLFTVGAYAYGKWSGSQYVEGSHERINTIRSLFKDKDKNIADLKLQVEEMKNNGSISKEDHDAIIEMIITQRDEIIKEKDRIILEKDDIIQNKDVEIQDLKNQLEIAELDVKGIYDELGLVIADHDN